MNIYRVFTVYILASLSAASIIAGETTPAAVPHTKQIYLSSKIIESKSGHWIEALPEQARPMPSKHPLKGQPILWGVFTPPQFQAMLRSAAQSKDVGISTLPSIVLLSGDHVTITHPKSNAEIASFSTTIRAIDSILDLCFFQRDDSRIGQPEEKLPPEFDLRRVHSRLTIRDGETVTLCLPCDGADKTHFHALFLTCQLIDPAATTANP